LFSATSWGSRPTRAWRGIAARIACALCPARLLPVAHVLLESTDHPQGGMKQSCRKDRKATRRRAFLDGLTGGATASRFAVAPMHNARTGGIQAVHRLGFRMRGPIALAMLALPAGLYACQSPTAPPPPPGGGQVLTLDWNEFQQNVEPVLVRQGCDATGD